MNSDATEQDQKLRVLLSTFPGKDADLQENWTSRFIEAASAGHPVAFLRILADRAIEKDRKIHSERLEQNARISGPTEIRNLVDLAHVKDEQGSTALHYAACFGHTDIVRFLLGECEADPGAFDGRGWTPIQWAQLNGHQAIVDMLKQVEQQAPIHEISLHDSNQTESQRTINGDGTVNYIAAGEGNGKPVQGDFYRPAFDFDAMERELAQVTGHGFGSGWAPAGAVGVISSQSTGMNITGGGEAGAIGVSRNPNQSLMGDADPEEHPFASTQFQWDQCLPTEMLVFDPRDLDDRFRDLRQIPVPAMNRSTLSQKIAYANTVFLMARYAHYVHGGDLLDRVLVQGVRSISEQVKAGDWSQNAYWLSNASHLLYTLKRDPGLNGATAKHQLNLSEIVEDIYSILMNDAMKHLAGIVSESMSFMSIKTEDDAEKRTKKAGSDRPSSAASANTSWGITSMFKRSSSKDHLKFLQTWMQWTRPDAPPRYSPQTILTYLASLLFVMQSYHCHPSLQKQCLIQLCEHIGKLMGDWLASHECMTRSLAMNVAMNISVVEGWLRSQIPTESRLGSASSSSSTESISQNQKPSQIGREPLLKELSGSVLPYLIYLEPIKQVCQLLQVATTSFSSSSPRGSNLVNTTKREPMEAPKSVPVTNRATVIDNFLATLHILSQSTISHYGKNVRMYQFKDPQDLQQTAFPIPGVHWLDLKALLVDHYQPENTESLLHEDLVEFLKVMGMKWSAVKPDESAPSDADSDFTGIIQQPGPSKTDGTGPKTRANSIPLIYPLDPWPHFPKLNQQSKELSFTFHMPVFPRADESAPQIGIFNQTTEQIAWENIDIQAQEIRKQFLEQMRQSDMDFWRRTRIEVPTSIMQLFST